MSGKVRTTWISDEIWTCLEKKVWNSVSGKYRTGLHLVYLIATRIVFNIQASGRHIGLMMTFSEHRRWIISVFDRGSIMNRLYWHKQQVGYLCFIPFVLEQRGVMADQGSIALNWYSRYNGTRYCGTWLYIVNLTLRNKLQWNSYIFIHENVLENIFWKMAAILSRPQHCSVPSICDLFCTLSVFVELALCAYRTQCHSSNCLVVTSGTLMFCSEHCTCWWPNTIKYSSI